MADQAQITIERDVWDRLEELRVPPLNDISEVPRSLIYNASGKATRTVQETAAKHHNTYDEEVEVYNEGHYSSSGISP